MLVPMVNVRIVRMGMFESFVPMRMRVRFAARIVRRMLVLVMGVVRVFVLVSHWLVNMHVFMRFGQMQPDSQSHQNTCC